MSFFLYHHPVGLPGLVIMMAGGLLFFASVVRMRIGARAPAAPAAAKRRSSASAAGIFLQMLGFTATGFGLIQASLPAASPEAMLEAAAVAALMAGSVLMFVAATRAMGANWSVVARMREGHELVTSGIFAHLRHPIYVGMTLFLVALAIAFGHERNLVVGAPLFLLGTWIRVHEEEKLLRAEFGRAYGDYAARVKRFVPGII